MIGLQGEREAIVRHARRLRPDGLVTGTAGNISVRAHDLVAVTPSGVDYEDLTPEAITVVDIDGNPVEGDLPPSTELPMHIAAYRSTPARAVVHAHPPYATALSTVVEEVPAVHYLMAKLGGPIAVAPYATPGSAGLASSVRDALRGRAAVLLRNHGSLAIGDGLADAYDNALLLEWLCALYYRALLIGRPRALSGDELGRVAAVLAQYGAQVRSRR